MWKFYYGGTILTMEQHETVEAVLTCDDKIYFAGSKVEAENILQHSVQQVEWIDLQGKTMLPGFIDGHSHISLVASYASFADLSECNNHQDIIDVLNEYKIQNHVTNDGIIMGCSYDHNFLDEQAHPTREILDQVSLEIPIFIFHISNHMGVANSKLLELAGIDEHTHDPEGGVIHRDQNGMPNGLIEETTALQMVLAKVYNRVKSDFTEQMDRAQQLYFSYGITTAQDGASDYAGYCNMRKYADSGRLKIDIVSYIMEADYKRTIAEEKTSDSGVTYQNHLRIGGAKTILDGSPQGKTAWLTQPYEGESEYCGYPTHTDQEVLRSAKQSVEEKYQLLAHCNGDAACEQLICSFERALKGQEALGEQLRPVMIHCQTVRKDQLLRMKKIGMIPSFFLAHTYYWGDIHLKNLGTERGNRISPIKDALDAGLVYNFHQDSPVVKPDMMKTIWCAVNRITRTGKVIGADQRIDVSHALKGITIHPAYEYHEEERKGTISAGKLADFCILNQNPEECDPKLLDQIVVLETIKNGVTVYRHTT